MLSIQAITERANAAQRDDLRDTNPPDINNRRRNPKAFALAEVKCMLAYNLIYCVGSSTLPLSTHPLSVVEGRDRSAVVTVRKNY